MCKKNSKSNTSPKSNSSRTNPNFGDRKVKGQNPNLPTFRNPPPPPKKK